MTDINIVDQTVIVEIRDYVPDSRQLPPWTAADVSSGRLTWGRFRNSRWRDLVRQT